MRSRLDEGRRRTLEEKATAETGSKFDVTRDPAMAHTSGCLDVSWG